MAEYIYGIKSIKYGAVCSTGTSPCMPATGDLTSFAQTVQGSLTISEDEYTLKEFFVEETTTAVKQVVTDAGGLKITWRAYDVTPTLVAAMKGGTATGDGTYTIYFGPETVAPVELSLEVTTTDDVIFDIFRASCTARFDSVVGRENLLELEIVAEALAPETTGTGAYDQAPYQYKIPV